MIDERDGGLDRRQTLKCMLWAGTGVVWTVAGGVPSSRLIGSAKAAEGSFSFVQISDSHIGFEKPANPDARATLSAAVDKVLAVFGRAEPRDFIDLAALSQIFNIKDLFREAVRKDQGFDLQIFAEMTNRLTALPRREFPISNVDYDELKKTVGTWRDIADEVVLARDRDRGMER